MLYFEGGEAVYIGEALPFHVFEEEGVSKKQSRGQERWIVVSWLPLINPQ